MEHIYNSTYKRYGKWKATINRRCFMEHEAPQSGQAPVVIRSHVDFRLHTQLKWNKTHD